MFGSFSACLGSSRGRVGVFSALMKEGARKHTGFRIIGTPNIDPQIVGSRIPF